MDWDGILDQQREPYMPEGYANPTARRGVEPRLVMDRGQRKMPRWLWEKVWPDNRQSDAEGSPVNDARRSVVAPVLAEPPPG